VARNSLWPLSPPWSKIPHLPYKQNWTTLQIAYRQRQMWWLMLFDSPETTSNPSWRGRTCWRAGPGQWGIGLQTAQQDGRRVTKNRLCCNRISLTVIEDKWKTKQSLRLFQNVPRFSFIFISAIPLGRVAGAAALGEIEITNCFQQSQIVLLAPHQDVTT